MRESKSYEKHPTHQALYDALMQSLILEEYDMEKAKAAEPPTQKKRRHDDKDQYPPARPNQGLKRRKTSKNVEASKKSKSIGNDMGNTDEKPKVKAVTKDDWKPTWPPTPNLEWNTRKSIDDAPEQSWPNDMANAEKPTLTFDDWMSTPIDFSAFAMNRLKINKLIKADLVRPDYNLLKGMCKSCVEIEYNMEEYFFFNNDLEYLRGGSTDRKYSASKTKTKAAKYEIEGIEDIVPKLWSPINLAYYKYASLGISHWGPKRQRFYGHLINRVSRNDVYSTMRILSVTSVSVDKWYGYGHLKEIVIRRADQKLYKFMEGDFPRLHLNDIKDMLLLVVQNRLNNLKGDVIVDLEVALCMYTRRIVIQKRVEDLQLGVKSYQKKLNISKPQTRDIDISFKELYTTHSESQGVVYEDKLKRKRLMRTNKLYKFSDGTLDSVCNTLWQMLMNFHLGYNKAMKRRKWTVTYKKRTRIMIKAIDQ
ncbi:hypothetical protein Tco_1239560 [Tanacetum coccineum]